MGQSFLHDCVPEYIRDAAYYILSEGRCAKINIQEGETWDVQGVIQGRTFRSILPAPEFHPYRPQHAPPVQLLRRLHRHLPPCGRPGHAPLAEELRKEQGDAEETPAPVTGLEAEFPHIFFNGHGARTRTPLPYFPFPRAGARAPAGFIFPRPRQNKSGLSTVHNEITLQQIIQNPEWSEFFAPIAAGCKANRPASGLLRAQGGNSRRPDLVVFLGRAQGEYYLLWKNGQALPHRKHAFFSP